MRQIQNFDPEFAVALPETCQLLKASNLTVHPQVSRITLHGSRGLTQNYHPDSDIDLSLLVDIPSQAPPFDIEDVLQAVFEVSWTNWRSPIEVDLAVIFDVRQCALACFDQTIWRDTVCTIGGVDCFGLFKRQRGFSGLVRNAGIQVKRMYPCLKIWQRA